MYIYIFLLLNHYFLLYNYIDLFMYLYICFVLFIKIQQFLVDIRENMCSFIHYLRKKFIYFNIRVTSKLLASLVLNTCNVCHYYYS